MPAHLHRLEDAQTEWKAGWWSVPVLLYALFFLLYTLYFTPDQDCGRCKYVLGTANRCTLILCVTTSSWNIGEAVIAVGSAQTDPLICYYLHYITIIAIIFSIICIIPQQKVSFWVGIHCRLQANHIIHHGRTLFVASSSGVDSILAHKGAFYHCKAGIGLPVI